MDWVRIRPAHTYKIILLVLGIAFLILNSADKGYTQSVNQQSPPTRMSLNVFDTELSKIVQMLMRDSQQSIYLRDQGDLCKQKVTVALNDMPFEQILRYVVDSAGGSLDRDEYGVYIIKKKEPQLVSAVPNAQYDRSPAVMDERGTAHSRMMESAYLPERRLVTESIKLYNVGAVDMMWTLQLYDFANYGKMDGYLNPPGWNKSSSISAPPSERGLITPPTADALKLEPTTAERAASIQDESLQFGGTSRLGGGNQFGGNQFGGNQFGGSQFGGTVGGTTSRGRTRGLVPEDIELIIPYPVDNSLLVKGTEEAIEELKELITKLDIAPVQITVKAEFVTLSRDIAKSLGVDWNIERFNTTFNTGFGPSGNINFGYADGNVMALLRTQILENNAKLVLSPMVTTMNNVPGPISIGKVVPYWTSSVQSTEAGYITSTSPQFLNISTRMNVLPRVNPADNSIFMQIQLQVNDAGDPVKGPDGTEIPVQNTQNIDGNVRVANGETVVFRGFTRKSDSKNVTGIPFLKDLPIIGKLFSNESKRNSDSELLVFVTAFIKPEKAVTGGGVGVGVGVGVPEVGVGVITP